MKLGAVNMVYLNSDAVDAAAELQKMGGARAILSTAPSGKAMSAMIDGLGAHGELIVVGASGDPIEVSPAQLIGGMKSIQGWAAGLASGFRGYAQLFSDDVGSTGPMIEKFPLSQAPQAFDPNDVREKRVFEWSSPSDRLVAHALARAVSETHLDTCISVRCGLR